MNYAAQIASFADNQTERITDEHDTNDIINLLIGDDDGRYQYQVKPFTDSIKNLNYKQQCQAIFSFLKKNVKYNPDSGYIQQLKSPARLFADGEGDCKSFSLFIANCFKNLGIPYMYRFISEDYKNQTPTHVFVIALGTPHYVMDRVVGNFNISPNYAYKYDKVMPLNRLTGLENQVGKHKSKLFSKLKADVEKKTLTSWIKFCRKLNSLCLNLIRRALLYAPVF